MKKILTTLLLTVALATSFAQIKYLERKEIDRRADSIVAEGKALFRSEWASWYGTDIFLAKCPDKRPRSGGYFSYETPAKLVNVFYGKGDHPDVIASITFNKDFNPENYTLDTVKRSLTKAEMPYLLLRQTAIRQISTDTTIKKYNNTDLNPVPLITNGQKKVYLLTAPHANGVVLYGNDYLIRVDDNYAVSSVYKIHNSLLVMDAGSNSDTSKIVKSCVHSHLTGKDEFISATDICTTSLYGNITTWSQVYVISKNYVSIWDCKKKSLLVLTMEAWERINKDQGKN